jgi:hypothetical protein
MILAIFALRMVEVEPLIRDVRGSSSQGLSSVGLQRILKAKSGRGREDAL